MVLPVLGSLLFMEKLMEIWNGGGKSRNIENMDSSNTIKYSNHIISNEVLKLKADIEESGSVKTTAYQDARGVWTIGIGMVYIYDENGKFIMKVTKGLTLSTLKSKMNKSSMSDLDFCYHLIRNHSKLKVKGVFADLDTLNIPYNEGLANALVDFYFNSGGMHGTSYYHQFISDLRSIRSYGASRDEAYAKAYVRYRLGYLKSQFKKLYGSWIRRTQIYADRMNTDKTMDNKNSWKKYPTTAALSNYVKLKYGVYF